MGNLSNAMQSLVDDIKFSTDNRRVNISEMRSETGNMIERFHLAHQDMAKELQEKFSSEKATRVEDVERLMNDIRSELRNMTKMQEEKLSSERNARLEAVQQLMNGIRTTLEEKFSSEHALRMEAQEQLVSNTRDFMKNIGADLQNMAEALRVKLSPEEAVRVKDIRQFIDAIAADCRKAHEVWMNRSVDTVEEEVAEKIEEEAVSLPAAEEEETVAEEKEETAGKEEESLPPPIAEEVESSLEARVLETITKHSEGIKLVDIGNELGVDWRGLIGGIKSLVDEDKVEKTDNLYYPKS